MAETRILVVEDDGASARLIEMTLKSLGYAVPAVISSGEEAINKAGEVHPDLVLMDIHLKGDMDGVQAAEEICARYNIPVVYLTAYADNDTLQRAKITEPYGYILKPFQKRELDASIEIALYKHKLDSKLKEREQALEKLTAELKTNNKHLQREVTERKRMEEELKHSEERLKILFEFAPDAYYLSDLKGNFVDGNKVAEEITGYKRDELIGKSFLKLGLLSPRWIPKAVALLAENALWKSTGPNEFVLNRKDGSQVTVEIKTFPVKIKGQTLILGIARDIAKRKRAEQEMKVKDSAITSSINAIAIADLEGNVTYINPAFLRMWGYDDEKEILGKNAVAFWQIAEEAVEIMQVAMDRGGWIGELAAKRKDGSNFDVQLSANVVRDEAGKPICRLGSFIDITERKKAQQAQESLSQQLQTKVSELEALSYGIAHDLRSPLLSIEGFSRLLRDDVQNQKIERVQEDIRLLESGVKKMQQFINRTLEYSRAGHLVKPAKNIPFDKIAKEVVAEFAGQVHSIGATVSLADTFPRVYADRMRIKEVLTNLIQNSINYRDKARPLKIEIGYRLSEHEVGFFVRDNGVGIDASETEKVFALFYRGATDSEGSGAGLAIAKRIIEAHGGRIWAESQSGEGATLCFTLPQQSSTKTGDNNEKN